MKPGENLRTPPVHHAAIGIPTDDSPQLTQHMDNRRTRLKVFLYQVLLFRQHFVLVGL